MERVADAVLYKCYIIYAPMLDIWMGIQAGWRDKLMTSALPRCVSRMTDLQVHPFAGAA